MKVRTDLSIGAALQACVSRTTDKGEPQMPAQPRPAAPSAGSRQRDSGRDPVREAQGAPQIHLTPRQLEVLLLVCEGLPNKMICRRLDIAIGTVKVHISSLLRALQAKSRLELLVRARELGIVRDEPAARSRFAADVEVRRLGEPPASNPAAQAVRVSPPAAARAGSYGPGHGVFADA